MNFNMTDNAIVRALSKLCDFMILNILWVICSIPLFTIGAATTAMYSVMLKIVKNEEGYIVKGFFGAFKANFKKSTILWLIIAAIGIVIGLDFRMVSMFSGTMRTVFQAVFSMITMVVIFVAVYAFPMTARYENTVKQTVKNALLLSVARLPYTLILLVIHVVPVILTLLTGQTLIIGILLWLVVGVSLVAWLSSMVLRKVFEILDPKDDEDSSKEPK